MNGIIIVNKPQGWTSFDVVAKLRNLTGEKKVGHTGTLDPIATGVLPVFIGTATKEIKHFMEGDKRYEAELLLGARSDTGDAEGKIQRSNVPLDFALGQMTNEGIIGAFNKYVGEIEQVPPMFSAVKIKGKKLYELARQGIVIERKPRKIKIYKIDVLKIDLPKVRFSLYCSKGTYVRQLAMDVGDDLGCGAYLTQIERVFAEPFHISQAVDMGTIVTLAKIGKLATIVISPFEAKKGLKRAAV